MVPMAHQTRLHAPSAFFIASPSKRPSYRQQSVEYQTALTASSSKNGAVLEEGLSEDAIRQYVSTMETVIDTRACRMDAQQLALGAQRLGQFVAAREGVRSMSSTAKARAREILRSLGQGNAQQAASRLRFRS